MSLRAAVLVCLGIALCAGGTRPRAQETQALMAFDEVLDLEVRDGYVYYRALQASRAPLDRFVASLSRAALPASRDAQVAFWLNAYNATVLREVVDHYPIGARTNDYPAHSIKQIAGVFERTPHLIAGRSVTLDQIEQSILPAFRDPRVFFALGRGAAGGGRLRGEVYSAESLERQLADQANECGRRNQCVHVDPVARTVHVSSIFSWRQAQFVDAYAQQGGDAFAARSPIERAILAFVSPQILKSDRDFLATDQFKVQYLPFDWTLNDLATRR